MTQDEDQTQLPGPVAWKMLPLSAGVLALGLFSSELLKQRVDMNYLAMDDAAFVSPETEKVVQDNENLLTAKPVENETAENIVVPAIRKLPEKVLNAADSAVVGVEQKVPAITIHEETAAVVEATSTTTSSIPSDVLPDPTADILAELNSVIAEGSEPDRPLPAIPLAVVDQDQIEPADDAEKTEVTEEGFIILTPSDKLLETVEPPQQVSIFEGEKIQISREMVDAVDSGGIEKVILLIQNGEDIDAVNSLGESALLKAAWNGDFALAETLIELGANMVLAADDGRTPLFAAAVSGNLQLVELILKQGADANTSTVNGKTPLMVSAWSDYPEMARLLLRYGADPDKIDNNGRNAIFYALWDRNVEVVKTLLDSGADLALVDKQGHSTMDIARLRRIILPGMEVRQPVQN